MFGVQRPSRLTSELIRTSVPSPNLGDSRIKRASTADAPGLRNKSVPINPKGAASLTQAPPKNGGEFSSQGDIGFDISNNVDIIKDNGEKLFYCDFPPMKRAIGPPPPSPRYEINSLIQEVQAALKEARIKCALNSPGSFIPRDKFKDILTPEKVYLIIHTLKCCSKVEDKHAMAQDICFGDERCAPRLKIFAILLLMDRAEDIVKFMDDGLCDNCLLSTSWPTSCSIHGRHNVLDRYMPEDLELFIGWRCTLSAPYIKIRKDVHSHYILQHGHCLPTEVCTVSSNDNEERTAQQGGFSKVYKVQIPSSQYNDELDDRRNRCFALKELTSESGQREAFRAELRFSLYLSHLGGEKKHLNRLLASFERHIKGGQSRYYFLFDWADGDLNEFWKSNEASRLDTNHEFWMVEQMSGLIEALKLIHNDIPRFGWRENLPEHYLSDVKHVYGRHGDLKPENILFFQNRGGKSDLVLADFGLGKLHSKISRRGEDPRTLARTETYRAPEFDLPDGFITPAADIWSLGCVFLEYVSWYLREANVIEGEFSQARLAKDSNTVSTESFFSIEKGKNERDRAVLKPIVRLWIRRLKENDNTTAYLKQILNIIEHEMLDLDATSRIKATALSKKFKFLFDILITRRMSIKVLEERDRLINISEQLSKMLSAANNTIEDQAAELVERREERDRHKGEIIQIKEDYEALLPSQESWIEKFEDLQDKYDSLASIFATQILPTPTDSNESSEPRRRGALGASIKKKSRRHDALPLPGHGDHQNQYDGLVARYRTSLPTPPHSEASSTSRQSRVSSFSTSWDNWEDRERFRQEHRRERRSHSQEKERLARRFENNDTESKRPQASARRRSVVSSKPSSHILSTSIKLDVPPTTTQHAHEQRPVPDQVKSGSPQNESSPSLFYSTLPLFIENILQHLPSVFKESPVPNGLVRTRWKCTCGAEFFDDNFDSDILSTDSRAERFRKESTVNVRQSVNQTTQAILSLGRSLSEAFRKILSISGPILPTKNPGPVNITQSITTSPSATLSSISADHLLLCVEKSFNETVLIQNELETALQTFTLIISLAPVTAYVFRLVTGSIMSTGVGQHHINGLKPRPSLPLVVLHIFSSLPAALTQSKRAY
ncbi:unnamed protein product [Clonostachys chloroleuca]|uniref:Protein kinase domain-containing protein n=1 Tax=Clonostachys chloroleuca TaxID=1926264 RepID=A0AA35LXU1_9HYPO|nr:unnamed protein product [Clonostachys chloroleuca]